MSSLDEFDPSNSYVPISFREALKMKNGQLAKLPLSESQSVWKDSGDGTIVLVSVDSKTRAGKSYRRALLDIKWLQVNQPVDPKVFSVEGLELPRNTFVIDNTLGSSIVEEVVGRELPTSHQGLPAVKPHLKRNVDPSRERFVYALAIFLVVAIVFTWFRRRKQVTMS